MKNLFNRLISGCEAWPLMLYGPPGIGKSCFALCLIDYAGGHYYRMDEFAKLVNNCKFGREVRRTNLGNEIDFTEDMLWEQLRNTNFAVIDEIGTRGEVTDAHYQALYGFLTAREFKPHLVISNFSLPELDGSCGKEPLYDVRITSRLSAGAIVELGGVDRRGTGA